MADFFEHLLGELKSGRLTREAALALLGRHASRRGAAPATSSARLRGEPLLLTENWQPAALANAALAELRRIACIVDADAQDAFRSAFADAAPQLEVVFVPVAGLDAVEDGLVRPADACAALTGALVALRERHDRIDAMVHLPSPKRPTTAGSVEYVLALLQALREARLSCDRLLLCAAHADPLSRCHAEAWIGVERTLHVLSPDMQASVLLTEAIADGDAALKMHIALLVAELGVARLRNVSYMAQQRHELLLRPATAMTQPVRLKPGGTYLITGGAGALGCVFAEHLAQRYRANLVLTGRSALADASAAELDRLRENGAEIVYETVDVADVDAMRDCVERARSRFGALHGVIHAAGIQGEGLLFDNGMDRVRQVLRPKVAGTLALDEVLSDCTELEFFCSFSSNAAVLGDFGSFDYAIANRFQMAYAQHAAPDQGRLRLAIGWPFWSVAGMGSDSDAERTQLYLDSSGQKALEPRLGLRLFELMLQGDGGFMLVMYGDAQRLRTGLGLLEPNNVEPAPGIRRSAAQRGLDLEQCIAQDLTEQISDLLKLSQDRIRPRQNLTEYGFDSIHLARWAKQISRHYDIELTPAVFFSHPTLRQVVEYLARHHAERLRAFYAESIPSAPAIAVTAAPVPVPVRTAMPAARTDTGQTGVEQAIAIVGISGRFPQAHDADALWRILFEGRDAITEIPLERFDWRPFYGAPEDALHTVSKWLGVLPCVDEFDPLFFEISPREAEYTDPRQRLLLQEAWHALEDAGYGERQLRQDRIGMFVGVEQGDYQLLAGPHGTLTGNHDAILASRLSYVLDLQGPAMAINTSCSSGLVAAHQACLSLRADDCDAAIAAAVNLMLTPFPYVGMSRAGMLSETGRCYAFDERANGMVPGEAVVALVLKRLSRAQADRDPIHAVIVGSGINYDGKTNGITAPNGAAQMRLIEATYARAGIAPEDVDYVVAHGTATRLGDPVEVGALDQVFGAGGKRQYCALTSTKSNLGHTFAASGLVSLISLVLALRHQTIPASLHCDRPSDYIDWSKSAFYVNRANRPWPRDARRPRLGAVSAFGMSGTNAHMVVRDHDDETERFAATAPAFLLALSATTEAALRQRIADLLEMLRADRNAAVGLAALSHTLLAHRQHFAYRCAMIAEDREQALSLLEAALGDERSPAIVRGKVSADFEERPALKHYADGVLRALPAQENDRAAYRESLTALADLYVQGYLLDWRALYAGAPPRRVRLPAYPFARQRYWCERGEVAPVVSAPVPTVAPVEVPAETAAGTVQAGLQYVAPAWEVVDAAQFAPEARAAFAVGGERPMVIGGGVLARTSVRALYPGAVMAETGEDDDIDALAAALDAAGGIDHMIWIAPQTAVDADVQLLDAQRHGVVALFRLIKALLARGFGSRPLAWTVVTFRAFEVHRGAALEPVHAGVHGLVGSMAKEYPHWAIRALDLQSDADWLSGRWASVPADPRARPWACREQRWHRQQLVAVHAPEPAARPKGGVYVVVGGAGHVGTVWTEHAIRGQQAQVVWIGRRPRDARIQASIDRLAAFGPAPDYIVADAADADSLEQARREINRRHGPVDGVVLSSIHLDPCALQDMDEAHLFAALRAKLDVSIRIVDVFGSESLRLLLFFSSLISFIRNPLQSGYAAGCAFADAYARALRQRFPAGEGPMVKIMNWGFWDRPENLQLEGFAKMSQMGIGLIGPADGMAALDRLLEGPLDQMGVVRTTKPALIEGMSPKSAFALHPERTMPDMADLQQRVHAAAAKYETRIAQRSGT